MWSAITRFPFSPSSRLFCVWLVAFDTTGEKNVGCRQREVSKVPPLQRIESPVVRVQLHVLYLRSVCLPSTNLQLRRCLFTVNVGRVVVPTPMPDPMPNAHQCLVELMCTGKNFCFICGCKLKSADHCRHFNGPGLGGPFGPTCKGHKDPDFKGEDRS